LCPPSADDETIVIRTEETIARLSHWEKPFRAARSIAVKINAGVDRVIYTQGRQTELTEPAVIEGTIRALRAVTDSPIIVGDAATDGNSWEVYEKLGLPQRLSRYANVRLFDFNSSVLVEAKMRHANPMFKRYWLPREIVEADAIVSVAKMKAHSALGCTLSIKNLFGWMPTSVYGAPRMYLHDRLIRLPRVLSDLAQHLRPALNVVDGIVAASKTEWGGDALTPGVLLAGTNSVATDSIGACVMGFDPTSDYPDYPFFYRRNVIKLAAEAGLGPNRREQIEVLGTEPESVVTPFEVQRYSGNTQRPEQLRRGAACVESYVSQQAELATQYAGRYLALDDSQVLWDAPDFRALKRLLQQSGRTWHNAPQLLVHCLPPQDEVENFPLYTHEAVHHAGDSAVLV
jgi:uncharacterized protein (DUF362 family)